MLRSLTTLALLSLVLTGCDELGNQVSLTGQTDNPVATDATTGAVDITTTDTQKVMEKHGPTAEHQAVGTEPQTRVMQKPVVPHADGDGHDSDEHQVEHAVCVLHAVGKSGVSGIIRFDRQGDSLHVSGTVKGLSPGKHGFHIHEFGDLRDLEKGMSTGGHFNPTGAKHGHREGEERHAGDFGNIEAGEDGVAKIDFTDKIASINGPHSIVGHGVVVHADEDKFTQPTGDAGGRVAIGIVGVANPEHSK